MKRNIRWPRTCSAFVTRFMTESLNVPAESLAAVHGAACAREIIHTYSFEGALNECR
jgi:hypothetical protein